MGSVSAPLAAGAPHAGACGGSATPAAVLDGRTINQAQPEHLAADLRRILAGPPCAAAAPLRAAAEGGVVQAQLVYGQWLLDGRGVTRDPAQAVQWFHHAARRSEPMALNMLGQCHAQGWGVAVNFLMAAYWFRLAALGGLDWGMYNYATALTLGQGVEMDRAAALDWFLQAAALDHAKSMNMVGSFHEDGWVVDRDLAAAARHYRRAAERGDFRGQFNTARLLIGEGRIDAALPWLTKVPTSATPAFLHKATAWLQALPGMPARHPADRERHAPLRAVYLSRVEELRLRHGAREPLFQCGEAA
jgi:TPR repeat protein